MPFLSPNHQHLCTECAVSKGRNYTYAQFYERRINLGLVIPRSEDIPRFILGLSFGILATLSVLGITILSSVCKQASDWSTQPRDLA